MPESPPHPGPTATPSRIAAPPTRRPPRRNVAPSSNMGLEIALGASESAARCAVTMSQFTPIMPTRVRIREPMPSRGPAPCWATRPVPGQPRQLRPNAHLTNQAKATKNKPPRIKSGAAEPFRGHIIISSLANQRLCQDLCHITRQPHRSLSRFANTVSDLKVSPPRESTSLDWAEKNSFRAPEYDCV